MVLRWGLGWPRQVLIKKIEELEKSIVDELKKQNSSIPVEKLDYANETEFKKTLSEYVTRLNAELKQQAAELSAAEQKSKTLGNVRTGTLAASTATNIAGAILSGTNKVKGDLQIEKIKNGTNKTDTRLSGRPGTTKT